MTVSDTARLLNAPSELPLCPIIIAPGMIINDTRTRHRLTPRMTTETGLPLALTKRHTSVRADKVAKVGRIKFIWAFFLDTWNGPGVHLCAFGVYCSPLGCGVVLRLGAVQRSYGLAISFGSTGSVNRLNTGSVRACEVDDEILAVEIASAGLYGLTDLNPRR